VPLKLDYQHKRKVEEALSKIPLSCHDLPEMRQSYIRQQSNATSVVNVYGG
jgi:hypothetical protein